MSADGMSYDDGCSVSGPCGHFVPFDAAWVARDQYECPRCGLAWRVDQDPPEVLLNGFVMPGKRTVVIEAQGNLPMALPVVQPVRCEL